MRRQMGHQRSGHGPLVVALACLALVLSSCTRRATQLVAVVETDLPADQYACISVVVSRLSGGSVVPGDRRMYEVPAVVDVPFSLGITPPDGDASRRVQVTAEAWPDCSEPAPTAVPVVARTVRTGFLPEQTLLLSLFLADRCRTAACSATQTCNPSTGACEDIPEVAPTDLAPTTPGDELVDAGVPVDTGGPVDAGPRPDGGPAQPCMPVPPTNYYPLPAVAFAIGARPTAAEWVLFVGSSASSVVVQTSMINGMGATASSPLETTFGASAIAAITLPGSDDLLIPVSREGASTVDRHLLRPAMGDVATPDVLAGVLRQGGVAALLGTDALVALDASGTGGAPVELRRMGATGTTAPSVYASPLDRDVAIGPRFDGSALVALTDGTTAGQCEVFGISAAGVASGMTPVAVDTACAAAAIGELSDGRVVLAFVDGPAGSTHARYVILDAGLTAAGPPIDLGLAGTGRMSVTTGVDGSFRVLWDGTTQVSARHVDADGTLRGPESLSFGTGTPDYGAIRTARQGRTTAMVFPGGRGLLFAAVCD